MVTATALNGEKVQRDRCTRIVAKALASVRPQFRLAFHHGAHGVGHWSRVWHHGWHLARSLDVDPAVLAWFAYLHDSQRHNEYTDPMHGPRAADYAVQLRGEGVITELSGPNFERLCEAMRLHSDGHTEGDPVLRACWDADRLDLLRVGIEPDPRYLCTSLARSSGYLAKANRLARSAAGAWR